jgi:SAM-dependent methyltransferase
MPEATAAASPERVREAAIRLLAGLPACDLLDVPCGTGLLGRALVAKGFRVVGADADPAPARAAGLEAVAADMEAPLPFAAGAFGAVACVEGIEHVEGQRALLSECARVLRPGGVLVVTTPNVLGRPSRESLFRKGYARFFRPTPVGSAFPYEHAHRHPIDVVRLDFLLREVGLVPDATDGDAGGGRAISWRRRLLRSLAARSMRRHNPRADLLLHPAVFHSRVVAVRARKPAP